MTGPVAGTGSDQKTDLKKTIDGYRAKQHEFRTVELPPTRYLMIDGHGDPNTSPEFSTAVAALYPVAYKLKFASKQDLGRDYVVMPLEGLWSSPDMRAFTTAREKSRWDWTMMIMVPEWTTADMFTAAVAKAAAGGRTERLGEVRFETLDEGRCVQTLHIGSFDDEAEVLHRMHHEVIPAAGLTMTGRHHEIYLSDFRKVAPSRQRTILRQPVR